MLLYRGLKCIFRNCICREPRISDGWNQGIAVLSAVIYV